jgi:hypothetical protein
MCSVITRPGTLRQLKRTSCASVFSPTAVNFDPFAGCEVEEGPAGGHVSIILVTRLLQPGA